MSITLKLVTDLLKGDVLYITPTLTATVENVEDFWRDERRVIHFQESQNEVSNLVAFANATVAVETFVETAGEATETGSAAVETGAAATAADGAEIDTPPTTVLAAEQASIEELHANADAGTPTYSPVPLDTPSAPVEVVPETGAEPFAEPLPEPAEVEAVAEPASGVADPIIPPAEDVSAIEQTPREEEHPRVVLDILQDEEDAIRAHLASLGVEFASWLDKEGLAYKLAQAQGYSVTDPRASQATAGEA